MVLLSRVQNFENGTKNYHNFAEIMFQMDQYHVLCVNKIRTLNRSTCIEIAYLKYLGVGEQYW